MRAIYKYELGVLEEQTILLPIDAKIIRVDDIEGRFYLWAIVDTEVELENIKLVAFKTGGSINYDLSKLEYLGFCKIFIQMELCLYIFKVHD